MNDIIWRTEKRLVSDLKPYPKNPRKFTKEEKKRLKESIDKFNVADPLIINIDNTVIGGNFRLLILKEKNIKEVDVRVPSRKLTQKEADELNLRLNKNQGDWDISLLSNFDQDLLKNIGWTNAELDKIFGVYKTIYTNKIFVPFYEPKNFPVSVKDLFDAKEYFSLLEQVKTLDCDKELKDFFILACSRFIRFNFKNIAEYYSNLSDKKIKKVFQDLFLVVVDFDSAIERGFVDLMDSILKQIKSEYE